MNAVHDSRSMRAAAWLGVAYLVIAAAGKLAYALPRLLWDLEPYSAHDLKYRFAEVAAWFSGQPVYGVVDGAVYPPASHAILWPLLGWLDLEAARALWAATTLLAVALLGVLLFRLADPAPFRHRLLLAGLPAAAYAVQMSILLGQMGVHVVAAAGAGAAFLFARRTARWSTDLAAALLLAVALVKPTLAAPLVVVVLIATRRIRPAVLTLAVYSGLSVIAAAAQPADLPALVRDWLAITGTRVSLLEGVPNLHLLLATVGLESWNVPATLVIMLALATWAYRNRRADPWLLLGVAALVARFGAHGRLYDDALLILAALAAFRVAVGAGRIPRRIGAGLFVAAWLTLLTPTWAFSDLGRTVQLALHSAHTLVWMGVLVAIARAAGQTAHPNADDPQRGVLQPDPA
jgi:hypothetical protein